MVGLPTRSGGRVPLDRVLTYLRAVQETFDLTDEATEEALDLALAEVVRPRARD